MTRERMLIGPLLVLLAANCSLAQESAQESNTNASSPESNLVQEASEAGASSEENASADPNLAAIRSGAQTFVDAFNLANASVIAKLWTVDGEYTDADGNTFTGRPAIEQAYKEFFKANEGAQLRIDIDTFKLFSDAVMIEEGSSLVAVPDAAAAISRYRAVHVKVDGQWKMASVRDQLVDAPVAQQNLADLEFLVGTWKAEEHGNRYVSVNRWVANRSFVQRDFTTTLIDGSQTSGVQLTGWNPLAGHVQSWMFNSDGGHAVGVWMPSEDGWIAQMQGTTGNGLATTSTNLLRRLDDNAYVWQSIDRTMGGNALSDTDEVVIKRQPPTK